MKAHLNAVGLIDVVAGAFFMALAVLVSLGFTLFAPWFYGAPLWRPDDAVVVIAAVALVSALFLAIGIPSLIAGHPGGMLPLTEKEASSFHSDQLPENLYVADASLLPKSLGNPPILTIIAVAKRISKICQSFVGQLDTERGIP